MRDDGKTRDVIESEWYIYIGLDWRSVTRFLDSNPDR